MATKHDVIQLHKRHPEWTAPQIAKKLDCMGEYVRATARRNGIKLPLAIRARDPNSIYCLGHAARKAGLTVEIIKAYEKME